MPKISDSKTKKKSLNKNANKIQQIKTLIADKKQIAEDLDYYTNVKNKLKV